MNLPVRTKRMIYILLLGAGIIAAILGGAVLRSEPLLWVGIVILAAAIALHMIFYRCPHCGRWLNRNFGEYCQFCGKDLYTDEEKGTAE